MQRSDPDIDDLALRGGRGDRDALERFIKATQNDVWRFIAHLSHPHRADDLTQETYLRALGALPRYAGRSSARTWLLAIAKRVVVDDIRYRTSRIQPVHLVDVDVSAHPQRGFSDVVELKVLLSALDPDQREALVLTKIVGLSYAEAADVIGCPVGTVRSRIARGRAELIAQQRDQSAG